MGFVDTADVKRLMQNPELISDIAKAVVEDPKAMDSLADDIADEFEDELQDDPELKKQIIDAALSSPDFKKKLVRKLVEEFDD